MRAGSNSGSNLQRNRGGTALAQSVDVRTGGLESAPELNNYGVSAVQESYTIEEVVNGEEGNKRSS